MWDQEANTEQTHLILAAAQSDSEQNTERDATAAHLIVTVAVEDDVQVNRPRAPASAGKVPPHHFLLTTPCSR